MALNIIWISFFIIAFVVAIIKFVFLGDVEIFPAIMQSTFESAKIGFELSLGFAGVMTLWLGIMKIGEKGGLVNAMARLVGPFFERLFPEIPKNHPASGSIIMNIAANMLGLDNAATPLGLKAMNELQTINPDKSRASNAMIMFLVLNTSGLTIIPVSIMVYRAQLGAADPSDVFLPILIATYFATIVGIIAVAAYQRINLFDKVILAYIGGLTLFIGGLIYLLTTLSKTQINTVSSVSGNIILFTIIVTFILMAMRKRVNVYETFIEGAKEGFSIAIKIIPYLVAILVAVGVFRTSGALTFLIDGFASLLALMHLPNDFVGALPTAFMKPLSGAGARGLMIDAMNTYGVDSFVGRLACTFQGATDTTFYILAVYFGSVGISKTRHAVACGLIADIAGVLAAILIAYLFFA